MLEPMALLLDSFWRAMAYCVHPRVIVLSLLPLLLMAILALGLGYFYWDAAVQYAQALLQAPGLMSSFWNTRKYPAGDILELLFSSRRVLRGCWVLSELVSDTCTAAKRWKHSLDRA